MTTEDIVKEAVLAERRRCRDIVTRLFKENGEDMAPVLQALIDITSGHEEPMPTPQDRS